MKATVLRNNRFEIEETEKPNLSRYGKGAIIKTTGCGLCGSDLVKIRTGKAKQGDVLGHEVIGEIVELNTDTSFNIGDRVVLGHHIPCFNCDYCRNGNYSMCRHFKETNIKPGGFSEYIYVSEEHLINTVFKTDINISDVEASFLEPLACCIRAVKRAKLRDNSQNLVIGLGSIGLLMGESIKAYGNNAYGCDLLSKRAIYSKEFGFNASFKYEEDNETLKKMKEYVPEGFDCVFLTAGSASTMNFALKAVRDGGTILVFSSVKDDLKGFTNNDIYYRELTIMGSYSPSPADLEDSHELIEKKKVKTDGISTVYPLEKINEAIDDTISNKIMKAYIKL